MSEHGYYGRGHPGRPDHQPPHYPPRYRQDIRSDYSVPPNRSSDVAPYYHQPRRYPDTQAGQFSQNNSAGNIHHQSSGNYDQLRLASIDQPQVIDYANRRLNTSQPNVFDHSKGDNVEKFSEIPKASVSQSTSAPMSSPLSKISLTELKNTLGGQLGNILSKSITQPSMPDDSQAASNQQKTQDLPRSLRDAQLFLNSGGRLPQDSIRDRAVDGANSQHYNVDRREFSPSPGGRSYDNVGGESIRYNKESNMSHRTDVEPRLKPLFPIAHSTEEKPRSILKRSILKKNELEQVAQSGRTSSDVVDEDDFLYGGDALEQTSPQPLARGEEVTPDTKPDTQKIISNPAFTALLKSIGLDDINMAQRVKEKQEAEKLQAEKLKAEKLKIDRSSAMLAKDGRRSSSISKEAGFGIDQTASFLSSGVVLDDLLKLKQPQKDVTTQSSSSSRPSKDLNQQRFDKQSQDDQEAPKKRMSSDGYDNNYYSSGTKAVDRLRRDERRSDDKSDRGRNDRRKDDDSYRGSGERSSRRRSRSPGSRRSPNTRRHSRSPAGRRRSRSPAGRRGSPIRSQRSRSPDKTTRYKVDKSRGLSPPRQGFRVEEDTSNISVNRWSELSPSIDKSSTVRRTSSPIEDKHKNLSVDKQLSAVPRKRVLGDTEPLPPSKSIKQETEDTGLHELLCRIPSDVKLTRSQFEELLKAHQAKQAAFSKEKEIMAQVSPLPIKKRESSPSPDKPTITRKVIADSGEDDFKNLKMVVRSDGSKTKAKTITDDDLLNIKLKRSISPAAVKEEPAESRRVVRRIGAMGNASLEKHVIESDKEKYLRDFEKAEWQKAFGDEPLLPRLSRQEVANIRQIIQFNREKLLKAEQQLVVLQEGQSDVMKNKRYASVGEQYHLDKTLEHNIRLQNELTADIKSLKKLIRDDELNLDEQFEQERKIREISRKKAAAAKAVESARSVPVKEESPPPEKQDRKYRRAMEDMMMAKSAAAADSEVLPSKEPKQALSKPGTTSIEYYDPGTHWCKSCNFVAFKLYGYLEHLQTSSHMKRREKIGKPWQPQEVFKPPRKSLISRQETVVQPMKGIEFVHPVDAFYCVLCNYFTGDKDTIEYHIKSDEHHKHYTAYLTDNPMYEKRYKMDKEVGLVEAKKLDEKRKEEQDRLRQAEREEEERRRDAERRKEKEKREAEELRKKEKLEKLKAKKKAEVLAITRGGGDDSDVEMIEEDTVFSPPAYETSQERIKRELLEKTRAKKAGLTEVSAAESKENAAQKDVKQPKEAKSVQEKVKAKAQQIEESVYGPKQPDDSQDMSGVFLPPTALKPKVVTGKMPSKKAAESSSAETKSTSQPTSSAAGTNTISPFVRKMMEMEKSGEIITTATVKAQQVAAAAPRVMLANQRFSTASAGPMTMNQMRPLVSQSGVMRAQLASRAQAPGAMGPPQRAMGPPHAVMGPRPGAIGPAPVGMRPPVTSVGPQVVPRLLANQAQPGSALRMPMGPPGVVRPQVTMGGVVRPQVTMGSLASMVRPNPGIPAQVSRAGSANMMNRGLMQPRPIVGFPSVNASALQMRARAALMAASSGPAVRQPLMRPTVRAPQVTSRPGDDLRPPGTGPRQPDAGGKSLSLGNSAPLVKAESSEESSSSDDEDDDDDESEENGNGAGHSFSLAGLLSQFSDESKKETTTPTASGSKEVAKSTHQSSTLAESSAVESSAKESTSVEVGSVSSSDELKQSNGQPADSTTTVDSLQNEADAENVDEMTFTVIDSVGDEEEKS